MDEEVLASEESFSDFTMVVTLDAQKFANVFALADSAGQRIAVTAGDGHTILDHEVVSYDAMNQKAEIWFKAETLSNVHYQFYLYYGFVGDPQSTNTFLSVPGCAWSSDYLAVYHFAEDPSEGVLKDWSPGSQDAVAAVKPNPEGPGWAASHRIQGAVGTGWEFDGIERYAYTENVVSADSSYTITAWFANSQLVDKAALAFQGPQGWNASFQRSEGAPNADLDTPNGRISWFPNIVDAEMHAFTWTLDGESDVVRYYFDGVEQNYRFRYVPPGSNTPIWTGESIDGRVGIIGPAYWNPFDLPGGVADEFRLIEGVRSPEWIATEYRNQSDPEGFFVVGEPQATSTGVAGPLAGNLSLGEISISPNPFGGVAFVSVQTRATDLTVEVFDARGRLVRTLGNPAQGGEAALRYVWDGSDAQGRFVSNGTYFFRARSGAAVATGKATLVR